MRISVPTETKPAETRVALTPASVHELVHDGHDVLVQSGAGARSGFPDADYEVAGARIGATADEVWAHGELLVKVKEPVEPEYRLLHRDQTVFAYLHLAASRPCTEAILRSGTTAIAFETVRAADGSLPLLTPMSEVAGRLAAIAAARFLLHSAGGRGVLPGGIAGVPRASAVVIGGGTAGEHATASLVGLGADVTVFDVSVPRLRHFETRFGQAVETRTPSRTAIAAALRDADAVIGSVLVPGAAAPKLVTLDMVEGMREGSVLVDIAIDQGGCFEGSRPTTHDDPVFRVGPATYYCVANMPAAVPVTSTAALDAAILPYMRRLAGLGWREAVAADAGFARGLTASAGVLHERAVAESLGLDWRPYDGA